MTRKKKALELAKYKDESKKVAQQLCYSESILSRIDNARCEIEVDNILKSARVKYVSVKELVLC